MTKVIRPLFVFGIAALLLGLAFVSAEQPQTTTGVYTGAQAAAGREAYQARCAGCHLPDMSGRNEAAPLAGANFMNAWRGRTTRDLFEYMSATMPPGGATLASVSYAHVLPDDDRQLSEGLDLLIG